MVGRKVTMRRITTDRYGRTVAEIFVDGSSSTAKKDSGLPLNRFLCHPVKKAFNEFVSVETNKSELFAAK